MLYAMFLIMQVDVTVTSKDPFGPPTCVAEQLVIDLRVLQCLSLEQYVPALRRTAG